MNGANTPREVFATGSDSVSVRSKIVALENYI